ncbi:MAG: hypothetical protein HYU66_19305 [Armatimonadetes bacterium]|nr:hypothetical protein [Armatimonadota bacterium]
MVYGVSIQDSAELGFGELFIPAAEMVRLGASALVVQAGPLRDECLALFHEWQSGPSPRTY